MAVNHQPQLSVKSPLFRGAGPVSKAPAQGDHILGLLRERGLAGATNLELIRIVHRFGGRVHDLRELGHRIRVTRESESVFRYILEPTYAERIRALERKSLPLFAGVRQ